MDKFEDRIKPNGTLVINTSLVDREPRRGDLQILAMPVNQVAESVGNPRGANMIILGAYVAKSGIVDVDDALAAFPIVFKGKSEKVINNNREAFLVGVEYARQNWM